MSNLFEGMYIVLRILVNSAAASVLSLITVAGLYLSILLIVEISRIPIPAYLDLIKDWF